MSGSDAEQPWIEAAGCSTRSRNQDRMTGSTMSGYVGAEHEFHDAEFVRGQLGSGVVRTT